MIPVLAVRDPGAAKRMLRTVFGFKETAPEQMALGDQEVVVCHAGAVPADLMALPLDHLALSVESADRAFDAFTDRGAQLDPDFTPDGPAEIPAFWTSGVRFVFFKGPDGAPLEFCQKLGDETGPGHLHYGLRTPDLDAIEDPLVALGATRVASHVLPGTPPVEVRFLALGDAVFELFDAPAKRSAPREAGWVGFIRPGG